VFIYKTEGVKLANLIALQRALISTNESSGGELLCKWLFQ